MRVAVYTAITADKDGLKEDQNFDGADFIAFTNGAQAGSRWTVRKPCTLFLDPRRNAKIHKILAHQYLADYDYSLWIDGSIRLVAPVRDLIRDYLGDADIAMFLHPERDCLYDEAQACIQYRLDSTDVITEQVAAYRAAGHPEHAGLNEAGVILRRHTPAVTQFNNYWWSEICRWSRRDQISVSYVRSMLGVRVALLPGRIAHNRDIVSLSPHNYVYAPVEPETAESLWQELQQVQCRGEERERAYAQLRAYAERIEEERAEIELAVGDLRAERAAQALTIDQLTSTLLAAELEARRSRIELDRTWTLLDREQRSLGFRLMQGPRRAVQRLFPAGSLRGWVYAKLSARLER